MTSTSAVLEIDLDAVADNWRALRDRHPSGPTAGVVKADAYGLGAARVASRLYAEGCRHFFTAHLQEALEIRALAPDAVVSALNGLWRGDAAEYSAHDVTPVLCTLEEVDVWAAEARRLERRLPALLHIDTGMNRLGLETQELRALAADPSRLGGLKLLYAMTHLVSAELPDDPVNRAQNFRFTRACDALPQMPRSLANSSGMFLGPAYASDLARPGAALYGINPTPGQPNPMRNVVRLLARVLQVRQIGAGDRVGYNGIWRANRPSRIATVSVGYADGYPRRLSNGTEACFDGRALPLVGRISMDLSTYDVTDHPGVVPGAWLELIGPQLHPDLLAARAGTNGYEILTSLGSRFARRYLQA